MQSIYHFRVSSLGATGNNPNFIEVFWGTGNGFFTSKTGWISYKVANLYLPPQRNAF